MSDERPPSTRELIAEGEELRADKKGRVPKTRQLVREAESLIGREGRGKSGSRAWLLLLVAAAVCGGALLYFLLTR